MKFHLSMPNDGQSNVYLINGLRSFIEENSLDISLTFSDHRNQSLQRTVDYINKIKPDVCLFLYLNDLYDFAFAVDCPVKAGWIFDITYRGKEIPESELVKGINELDYFFTITPDHSKKFKNGYWVPEAMDPCSHYPIRTMDHYDLTFVGQVTQNTEDFRQAGFVHLDRDDWLYRVGSKFNKLKIFGRTTGITRSAPWHTNKFLYTSWENNVVSTNSDINLGHSGWPDIMYSWSARDYRIMAAGGFLMTNRIKGHDTFFEDGINIVLYSTEEECIDKITYYANKPELRQKIAQKGMEKVNNIFTFHNSVEMMFTHMEII